MWGKRQMNDKISPRNEGKSNPVTIKTIANELGISFSTVSKALNNSSLVKEETRQIVWAKAKELGYSPNMLARGLRGKETKMIAAIINDTVNSVISYMLNAITCEMNKYGYTLMVCDPQFDEKTEQNIIMSILSKQPDFVIFSPATSNPENLKLFSGLEDKLIVMGRRIPGFDCNCVDVDYEAGGYMSASAVLSQGHREVLVLMEPLEFPLSGQFISGVERAFREYGLVFDRSRIRHTQTTVESGFQALNSLWNEERQRYEPDFTAIISFCDIVAHGAYKSLYMHKKRIPEDVSVIGFDDNPLNEFSMPPLTAIRLPGENIAQNCVNILKSKLLTKSPAIYCDSITPTLSWRKSVGPAPDKKIDSYD